MVLMLPSAFAPPIAAIAWFTVSTGVAVVAAHAGTKNNWAKAIRLASTGGFTAYLLVIRFSSCSPAANKPRRATFSASLNTDGANIHAGFRADVERNSRVTQPAAGSKRGQLSP